ncbi:MAG: CoA transferase, partial [Gammaproteobacteria bacterium]|nr:CoA transferase [Gammaproteobacteria bacterium]
MAGTLDGIRVLDLTTIYSGPIAASILGDQGADVVKV